MPARDRDILAVFDSSIKHARTMITPPTTDEIAVFARRENEWPLQMLKPTDIDENLRADERNDQVEPMFSKVIRVLPLRNL